MQTTLDLLCGIALCGVVGLFAYGALVLALERRRPPRRPLTRHHAEGEARDGRPRGIAVGPLCRRCGRYHGPAETCGDGRATSPW